MLPQMVRFHSFFKKDFIYLFLERGKGKEKERERNINVWLPLEHHALGTWPTTQNVPWLGIELATLWLTGPRSIHWATPARADFILFNSQVTFHCVNVPQLLYPLINWWSLGALPYLSYCKWCCRVRWTLITPFYRKKTKAGWGTGSWHSPEQIPTQAVQPS